MSAGKGYRYPVCRAVPSLSCHAASYKGWTWAIFRRAGLMLPADCVTGVGGVLRKQDSRRSIGPTAVIHREP